MTKRVDTPSAVRRRKRASAGTSPAAVSDQATLRTMSEIIARQTLAIEALAARIEAAERRLDLAAPAVVRLKPDTTQDPSVVATALERLKPDTTEPLIDDRFDPFRAARLVDWAQVLEGLVP